MYLVLYLVALQYACILYLPNSCYASVEWLDIFYATFIWRSLMDPRVSQVLRDVGPTPTGKNHFFLNCREWGNPFLMVLQHFSKVNFSQRYFSNGYRSQLQREWIGMLGFLVLLVSETWQSEESLGNIFDDVFFKISSAQIIIGKSFVSEPFVR